MTCPATSAESKHCCATWHTLVAMLLPSSTCGKATGSKSANFLFGVTQEVVAGFQPRAEDLEYPGKLLRAQAAAAGKPEEAQEGTPQQTSEKRPLLVDNEEVDGASPAVSGQVGIEGHVPEGTAPICLSACRLRRLRVAFSLGVHF